MDLESIKTFRHPADPARCEEEFKGRRLKAEGGKGLGMWKLKAQSSKLKGGEENSEGGKGLGE